MKLSLPPEIYSPYQLSAVLQELTDRQRMLEKAAIKQKVSGHPPAIALPELSPEAAALFKAAGTEATSMDSLSAVLADLQGLAQKAPQVHITLAAMPSEGLKKQLAAWLRQNLSPQVLVSFSYNSALLGGMVVRTGSRTFDWSFRRRILSEAGRFSEVLAGV